MLQNAPTLAIVAVDTDENEPSKVRQLDNWVRLIIGPQSPEMPPRPPQPAAVAAGALFLHEN